ncbi:MAG: hypothetical protein BWK76_08210 [Desulfobulbaceae bacterium A2]|nr:MAG: hypothetical protein BWK76_08210 [Desulfobulbaceae bacterium A2]
MGVRPSVLSGKPRIIWFASSSIVNSKGSADLINILFIISIVDAENIHRMRGNIRITIELEHFATHCPEVGGKCLTAFFIIDNGNSNH